MAGFVAPIVICGALLVLHVISYAAYHADRYGADANLGEILMVLGLALAPGHLRSIWPWLYLLYVLPLMLTRERADGRRCAAKYGALWDRYREEVPYRIIPRIY